MEINRLKQFLTVARLGSLRAASEVLHISPGGLSKSLAVFEDDLGIGALFNRDGRGIVLTDNGKDLERRGDSFLEAYDAFLGKGAVSSTHIARIATFEVFSTYFLGQLCDEGLSDLNIACFERLPGRIEDDVASRRVDFGITYEPVPMRGLEYLKIAKIKMGVFGRRAVFGKMKYSEWPFAAPNIPVEHAPSGVKGLDGWPDDKVPRLIRYQVDMMQSAMDLARRGLAVVHLPEFVARLHNEQANAANQLEELNAHPVRVDRWAYIVKRIGTSETKIIKIVARVLRQVV